MFLQFVPKTHLFFTAGKDKKIKQWDADKFEHIQTLEVTLFSVPFITGVMWPSARLLHPSNANKLMLEFCAATSVSSLGLTGPSPGGLVSGHQP